MSYGVYNRSLYRNGFRTYGQTDPFAATQLSGYPFTRTGGWRLHGLGDIVPDGAIVTYQGKWSSTYLKGAQDVITAVSAALTSNGLSVRSVSSNAGFSQQTVVGMTIHPAPFDVTLQIQVNNGMGYGDPNDIASIVRHEVYAVTGQMPISDSIRNVQVPGGSPQPTGQAPIGTDPITGAVDWNSWLQDNATLIGLTVAGIVILPSLLRRLL